MSFETKRFLPAALVAMPAVLLGSILLGYFGIIGLPALVVTNASLIVGVIAGDRILSTSNPLQRKINDEYTDENGDSQP